MTIHPTLKELLPSALHEKCRAAVYARGERIFALGDKPVVMFFVTAGEVVLERTALQGDPVVLQRTRNGFVAEASLYSKAYHCDGVATIPAEAVLIPVEAIRSAMVTDANFAMRWIQMLNRELLRLRLQCERLALSKLQDRVRHLIETEGQEGRYELVADLKSLAKQLGVSHEALYRCLSTMERNNALRRESGSISLVL